MPCQHEYDFHQPEPKLDMGRKKRHTVKYRYQHGKKGNNQQQKNFKPTKLHTIDILWAKEASAACSVLKTMQALTLQIYSIREGKNLHMDNINTHGEEKNIMKDNSNIWPTEDNPENQPCKLTTFQIFNPFIKSILLLSQKQKGKANHKFTSTRTVSFFLMDHFVCEAKNEKDHITHHRMSFPRQNQRWRGKQIHSACSLSREYGLSPIRSELKKLSPMQNYLDLVNIIQPPHKLTIHHQQPPQHLPPPLRYLQLTNTYADCLTKIICSNLFA